MGKHAASCVSRVSLLNCLFRMNLQMHFCYFLICKTYECASNFQSSTRWTGLSLGVPLAGSALYISQKGFLHCAEWVLSIVNALGHTDMRTIG